jgi:glutamine cyclotransferase
LRVEDEKMFPPAIKEGWGLTHNDTYLMWSDGSNRIHLLDKKYLKITGGTLSIKDKDNKPVFLLNELELVKDHLNEGKEYLYANIFQTNKIVKIDLD